LKAARRDGRLRLEATIWRSRRQQLITKLPKAEHDAPERQAAMEALILVATSGGSTMFRFNVRAAMRFT